MGRWESGLIQSPGTRPWGNSPGVRIPLCPPQIQDNPFNTYFQDILKFNNFKCPTSVQHIHKEKYLYKRNNIYYFCKRINNKVVKISLQSNDLNYCKRLRNKILERLNMAKKKEEEIVCKVIKVESRLPSQKPKDILFTQLSHIDSNKFMN